MSQRRHESAKGEIGCRPGVPPPALRATSPLRGGGAEILSPSPNFGGGVGGADGGGLHAERAVLPQARLLHVRAEQPAATWRT